MALTAREWKVRKKQSFPDGAELSALLTAPTGDMALLSSDAGRALWPLELDRKERKLRLADPLPLVLPEGPAALDLAALAGDPSKTFYCIGSHGLPPSNASDGRARGTLARITRDDNGGYRISVTSLFPILERMDPLSRHILRPLQENGVNIESLALHQDRLYVGFRGPSIDGEGFVIALDPTTLFPDGEAAPNAGDARLHRLALGPGIGVRGLCPATDGLLVLAGDTAIGQETQDGHGDLHPAGHPFALHLWEPKRRRLAPLGLFDMPRPELRARAISLLRETAKTYRVLVLFDRGRAGAPHEYRFPRGHLGTLLTT